MPSDHGPERDAHGCVPWCPVRLLDEQAGPRTSGSGAPKVSAGTKRGTFFFAEGTTNVGVRDFGDNGGPSRFYPVFYPDAPAEGEGPAMAVPLPREDGAAPAQASGPLRAEVLLGDARDVLATLPDAAVDAIVTDPPYALTDKQGGSKGFMGARWDTGQVAHDPAFWAEVLRVAKPGAFLLAFGGTRTYHRLACAIEDAGWECRDMLNWLQGSGFPKSKSCLKPAHEPILLAKAPGPLRPLQIDAARVPTTTARPARVAAGRSDAVYGAGLEGGLAVGVPPTTQGRWPPNALFSHVGGPGGCQPAGVRRVPADKRGQGRPRRTFPHSDDAWGNGHRAYTGAETAGDGTQAQQEYRCVAGCPVAALDRQAGPRTSSPGSTRGASRHIYGHGAGFTDATGEPIGYRDASPAVSRFFPTFGPDPQDAVPFRYVSKASRREREAGLDGGALATKTIYGAGITSADHPGTADGGGPRAARNPHPCVKPTTLMAWLCKLVTPEHGVVLDPFCGSGSTGVACVREGFGFIGIEAEASYVEIARARIAYEQEQQAGPLFAGVGPATTAAR